MNGWIFFFLMVVLKVPIAALFGIVWWAVHQNPDNAEQAGGDGGTLKPNTPHPRGPLPRPSRRGPHGEPAATAPARMRITGSRQHDRA
ncbi:MAG: hypothetical protein F2813_01550 [Actinobacteria bacterium]|uniref:Unannotated protein n=1 Tax=freshwater metagenome TaxID=449393 RepID=A0A6J5Z543_9ZZZZ|nr:hypothetical protein [Actinomycetota bacterium]